MTRSSVTSHVKVAPGHVIRPEIRRQGYITMSTVNCLNARRGGGRSRMFSPSDSRSGRGLGWSLALPIAYLAGAGIFVGRKEKIRGRSREGRKGEGASSLLRVFPSRGLEKKKNNWRLLRRLLFHLMVLCDCAELNSTTN